MWTKERLISRPSFLSFSHFSWGIHTPPPQSSSFNSRGPAIPNMTVSGMRTDCGQGGHLYGPCVYHQRWCAAAFTMKGKGAPESGRVAGVEKGGGERASVS